MFRLTDNLAGDFSAFAAGLPVNVRNSLGREGVDSFDKLCSLTSEDVICFRNLGYASLAVLRVALYKAGYKLKGDKVLAVVANVLDGNVPIAVVGEVDDSE